MSSISGISSYTPGLYNKNNSPAASPAGEKSSAPMALVDNAKPSAVEEFLAYSQKSWAEKMRDQILKSLGYTEEDLAALSPEKREAIEKKIADMMEEKIKEEARKNGVAIDLIA